MRAQALFLLLSAGSLMIAASSNAQASTDNFVEMQIASTELSSVVRTRLQTQAEFCPHTVSCPHFRGSCLVDRLEFPALGYWSRGASNPVTVNNHHTGWAGDIVYHQPMTVHIKTQACAYTTGCQTTIQQTGTVQVHLTAGQGQSLCFEPKSVSGFSVPVNVPSTPFCLDLDLNAVSTMVGSSVSVTGRGVSLSSNGARIGARFELDRPQNYYNQTRIDAWSDFLAGQLAYGDTGQDWSLFIHQSLMTTSVKKQFTDAVASSSDLAMLGSPSASWTGLGASGGRVNLSVGAEYDNCVDISPLTLSTQLSKNAPSNGISTQGTVNWDVSTWDAIWCGFLDGFIVGAIAGPIIASSIDLNDLGGMSGACQVTGEHTFSCNQQTHPQLAVLGHGWTLKSFLSGVNGNSSGLVMSGSLTQMGVGIPDIEVTLMTPTFGYRGTCNTASCEYLGGLYLKGNAKLCQVDFTNDPLGVFEVTPPASLDLPASYEVKVKPGLSDAIKTQYSASPYGIKATVFSSAGVETHQFAPTDVLPVNSNNLFDNEEFLCAAWDVKAWATNCLKPKWRPGEQRFHPEWVIDPWDHIVIVTDDLTRTEIGVALVEQMQMRPIWNAAGSAILGISLTGQAHIPQDADSAHTQALTMDFMLPRGQTAHSLEDAIAIGFRGGLSTTVAVDRAFLPRGVSGASFEMNLDQDLLFEMAH